MTKPVVKFHPFGYGRRGAAEPILVTIDGRQALREGPRMVGHCNRCKGQCRGATADCMVRVYDESGNRKGRRAT